MSEVDRDNCDRDCLRSKDNCREDCSCSNSITVDFREVEVVKIVMIVGMNKNRVIFQSENRENHGFSLEPVGFTRCEISLLWNYTTFMEYLKINRLASNFVSIVMILIFLVYKLVKLQLFVISGVMQHF